MTVINHELINKV